LARIRALLASAEGQQFLRNLTRQLAGLPPEPPAPEQAPEVEPVAQPPVENILPGSNLVPNPLDAYCPAVDEKPAEKDPYLEFFCQAPPGWPPGS
jgi:hypothetical protein